MKKSIRQWMQLFWLFLFLCIQFIPLPAFATHRQVWVPWVCDQRQVQRDRGAWEVYQRATTCDLPSTYECDYSFVDQCWWGDPCFYGVCTPYCNYNVKICQNGRWVSHSYACTVPDTRWIPNVVLETEDYNCGARNVALDNSDVRSIAADQAASAATAAAALATATVNVLRDPGAAISSAGTVLKDALIGLGDKVKAELTTEKVGGFGAGIGELISAGLKATGAVLGGTVSAAGTAVSTVAEMVGDLAKGNPVQAILTLAGGSGKIAAQLFNGVLSGAGYVAGSAGRTLGALVGLVDRATGESISNFSTEVERVMVKTGDKLEKLAIFMKENVFNTEKINNFLVAGAKTIGETLGLGLKGYFDTIGSFLNPLAYIEQEEAPTNFDDFTLGYGFSIQNIKKSGFNWMIPFGRTAQRTGMFCIDKDECAQRWPANVKAGNTNVNTGFCINGTDCLRGWPLQRPQIAIFTMSRTTPPHSVLKYRPFDLVWKTYGASSVELIGKNSAGEIIFDIFSARGDIRVTDRKQVALSEHPKVLLTLKAFNLDGDVVEKQLDISVYPFSDQDVADVGTVGKCLLNTTSEMTRGFVEIHTNGLLQTGCAWVGATLAGGLKLGGAIGHMACTVGGSMAYAIKEAVDCNADSPIKLPDDRYVERFAILFVEMAAVIVDEMVPDPPPVEPPPSPTPPPPPPLPEPPVFELPKLALCQGGSLLLGAGCAFWPDFGACNDIMKIAGELSAKVSGCSEKNASGQVTSMGKMLSVADVKKLVSNCDVGLLDIQKLKDLDVSALTDLFSKGNKVDLVTAIATKLGKTCLNL